MPPFAVCKGSPWIADFRFRKKDLLTSRPRRCCRECKGRGRRHTGWNDSGRCTELPVSRSSIGVAWTHFFREFVTKVRTSWFSSSSSIVPRYPSLLSAKRGDANSLRHSIWPKCVRSPSVKRYSNLATLFLLAIHHESSPLCLRELPRAPYVGISALFSKARPDGRTFFLYDGPLICNSL